MERLATAFSSGGDHVELVYIECVCKTCGNDYVFQKEYHIKSDAEIQEGKTKKFQKVCMTGLLP